MGIVKNCTFIINTEYIHGGEYLGLGRNADDKLKIEDVYVN